MTKYSTSCMVQKRLDSKSGPSKVDVVLKKRAYIARNVAIILLPIVVIIAFSSTITEQLHRWSMLPQQESMAELAFSEPASLPTHYLIGKPVEVNFIVVNSNKQEQQFRYRIVQEDAEQNVVSSFYEETITLLGGETKRITQKVIPTHSDEEISISVRLNNEQQRINFWMRQSAGE